VCTRDFSSQKPRKHNVRMSFDRFGRRLRMAKGKGNIGREILQGCARSRVVATDAL